MMMVEINGKLLHLNVISATEPSSGRHAGKFNLCATFSEHRSFSDRSFSMVDKVPRYRPSRLHIDEIYKKSVY